MPITAKRNDMRGIWQICLPIAIGQLFQTGFGFIMFRSAKVNIHADLSLMAPMFIILPMRQRHIIVFLLDKGKTTCQLAMISVMV
jgi:hypothetical protein